MEDDGGISDAKTRFKIAASIAATGLLYEVEEKLAEIDAMEAQGTTDEEFWESGYGMFEYIESIFVYNKGQWFEDKYKELAKQLVYLTSGATAREEEFTREMARMPKYTDSRDTLKKKINAIRQNIIFQLDGNYYPLPKSERKYFESITGYQPGMEPAQLKTEFKLRLEGKKGQAAAAESGLFDEDN